MTAESAARAMLTAECQARIARHIAKICTAEDQDIQCYEFINRVITKAWTCNILQDAISQKSDPTWQWLVEAFSYFNFDESNVRF